MNAFRVNADYELELFSQRTASKIINESLEFLFFFVGEGSLYSQKLYSSEYLSYIERVTGRKPSITQQGPYENWWGTLKNRDREKWWNSKITTTEFSIQKGLCSQTRILKCEEDIRTLDDNTDYLIKDPFGMSGQNFQILDKNVVSDLRKKMLVPALNKGPLIAEPWLKRIFDFSHYLFPGGKSIAYQNQVDEKFQYKGTSFCNYQNASVSNLSFFQKISLQKWIQFEENLQSIIQYFSQFPNEIGYSVDSFVYEENGELKIRTISEVNYRRTMGRVAYELAQKFGGSRPWAHLELLKVKKNRVPLWEKLKNIELNSNSSSGVMILSPGDTRFEIIFFSAVTQEEGEKLLLNTKSLLS